MTKHIGRPEPGHYEDSEEMIHGPEDLVYALENGSLVSNVNNLWMNLQVDHENNYFGQLKGQMYLERITDEADKAQYGELADRLTEVASPKVEGAQRLQAILSEEVREIMFQMYALARKHGVTHAELCR